MGIRVGPASPLDPKGIPGLTAWYRENMIVSAGSVTTWIDKTGRGNHLNVSGTPYPTLIASDSEIRGRPAVSFAANQVFASGPLSNNWFTSTYSIFVVSRYTFGTCGSFATLGRMMQAHNGNWRLFSNSCVPYTGIFHNSTDEGYVYQPTNVWTIHSHRYDGANITSRMLRVQTATAPTRTAALIPFTTNNVAVQVGFSVGLPENWQGRIAEIIVSNTFLDNTWDNTVFRYLQDRYAIG